MLYDWEESVEKDRYSNADPDDYRESDENVPWVDGIVGVVDGIHLDNKLRHDVDDGGEVEEPAEEVDETSEKAHSTTVTWTCSYGGPVIDTAGRWYGRGEL